MVVVENDGGKLVELLNLKLLPPPVRGLNHEVGLHYPYLT